MAQDKDIKKGADQPGVPDDASTITDAQTRDLREGDKPAVAEGIDNAPAAGAKVTAKASDANQNKIAKAANVKSADILSYNAERNTITTQQGGKYGLDADGEVVHYGGPTPEENKAAAAPQK
jgi:hypothetical protein